MFNGIGGDTIYDFLDSSCRRHESRFKITTRLYFVRSMSILILEL